MPLQALKPQAFKPPKDVVTSWDTWRKGWNNLLRENEIDSAEMAQATNLLLVGSGVPTKRWGSQDYYTSGATGGGRFILPIKDASENQQLISMTDWGYLVKKSGTTYSMITGASWASGYNTEGTQLGGNAYLVNPNREMVRYDFTTLTSFPTLASPTGAAATNLSLATGLSTWSWRITTVGKSGGETLGSTAVSLASLPQNLSSTLIRVSWNAVSAASGDLLGYNVYRGAPGDETWVGGVDNITTRFDDVGTPSSDPTRRLPVFDSTGGPKAKYIIRYQDRLILAGIAGQPTRVLISGRYPDQERFDWFAGGGFVDIEPDSGQHITGLGIHQEKLVIFKENSVWQVSLNQTSFGSYVILDPQYKLLTASQGCSSHRSIVPVENDLMFSNDKGIYILRYEPQLLNVINANEISAKIKPFFDSLSSADRRAAAGAYIDKKYVLSFPNSKQTISFDRERLAFTGPWPTPFGIAQWTRYVDSAGTERWVAIDSSDSVVTEFSTTLSDDKGTAIATIFKSKRENFGDWTIFKTINEVYMLFKAVTGSVDVNIYIEDRNGLTVTAKTFTITGSGSFGTSGLGTDLVGMIQLGQSANIATASTNEIPKKSFIYKSSRIFQIEIRTSGKTDSYELLGVKAVAIPQSRGNSPSAWNTTT
jgi:hypothetical protein